jgi:hypothetical protein
MHEVIHQWSDGYGASLTFTYVPSLPISELVGTPYAFVTFAQEDADVFADAADLRAIAATALAMAEAIEADATREGS